MESAGKYLYCIIRSSEARSFDGVAPIGNSPGPVYTLPLNGLSAVVSDSAMSEFDTTRANMLAHQRVLEGVMQGFTLLPVRFGTVAEGPAPHDDILRLLMERHQEFDHLLTEMDGKMELGIKALWRDQQAVFQEIVAENSVIRSLREALRDKPAQATHFDRIHLGEMVKGALERKRAVEAACLLTLLRPIALRTVENPPIVDRMVLNAAFLVDRCRENDFDQQVKRLEGEMGDRFGFKYVGPVPPYNFVSIVVRWTRALEPAR